MIKPLGKKNRQLDFGTYHHSTPSQSEKIREKVEIEFGRVFDTLPLVREDKLKIVDLGCGLGFLSCFCAQYYLNARITGIDTFEHASLKNSSLAKAKNNAKILGFSQRVRFRKDDIFSSDLSKDKFDLFVSNLVFHNFGRGRFDAYEGLARWMSPKSYAVLGDLFFDYKEDSKRLTSLFGKIEGGYGSSIGRAYRMLIISEPKKIAEIG
jgi:cyclopropane fatty-acyl-phospholipid synthase-like methyltransferase